MKLSEIANYLLDRIDEYSVETNTEGHYLTVRKGLEGLKAYIEGTPDSIYELLKEYDVKYVYVKDQASFGICFEDSALNAIRSLGNLCGDSNSIDYSSREIHDLGEEHEKEYPFDPIDVDLPF